MVNSKFENPFSPIRIPLQYNVPDCNSLYGDTNRPICITKTNKSKRFTFIEEELRNREKCRKRVRGRDMKIYGDGINISCLCCCCCYYCASMDKIKIRKIILICPSNRKHKIVSLQYTNDFPTIFTTYIHIYTETDINDKSSYICRLKRKNEDFSFQININVTYEFCNYYYRIRIFSFLLSKKNHVWLEN